MKYIAPLCLVFACFTSPSSNNWAIWIDKSQIVQVQHPVGCTDAAGAQIVTLAGTVCVVETPKQVLDILKATKE
jgi:trans-2-enoyl-CoA reductase